MTIVVVQNSILVHLLQREIFFFNFIDYQNSPITNRRIKILYFNNENDDDSTMTDDNDDDDGE